MNKPVICQNGWSLSPGIIIYAYAESKLEPGRKRGAAGEQESKRKREVEGEGGSTASDTLGSSANRSGLEHQRVAAKYSWPARSFGRPRGQAADEFLMRGMNLMANQSRNYRRPVKRPPTESLFATRPTSSKSDLEFQHLSYVNVTFPPRRLGQGRKLPGLADIQLAILQRDVYYFATFFPRSRVAP